MPTRFSDRTEQAIKEETMYFEMKDPDFWGRFPEHLKLVGEVAKAVGVDGATFVLGDPSDEDAPAAAIMRMPPHFVLSRHSHESERIEVIISGSLNVGDRVLGPGDVMSVG